MKVTVTAHCAFCARKFDAVNQSVPTALDSTRIVDSIVCDDADGVLCCDDCRCLMCGAGHATLDQIADCERFYEDNYGQDFDDADAFRDRAQADRAGAL